MKKTKHKRYIKTQNKQLCPCSQLSSSIAIRKKIKSNHFSFLCDVYECATCMERRTKKGGGCSLQMNSFCEHVSHSIMASPFPTTRFLLCFIDTKEYDIYGAHLTDLSYKWITAYFYSKRHGVKTVIRMFLKDKVRIPLCFLNKKVEGYLVYVYRHFQTLKQ